MRLILIMFLETDPLLSYAGHSQEGCSLRVSGTCGEEEYSHGAVVLLLGPPAERDHSHQEGHQGGRSAGHQQHQGGDLPVCRGKRQAG